MKKYLKLIGLLPSLFLIDIMLSLMVFGLLALFSPSILNFWTIEYTVSLFYTISILMIIAIIIFVVCYSISQSFKN